MILSPKHDPRQAAEKQPDTAERVRSLAFTDTLFRDTSEKPAFETVNPDGSEINRRKNLSAIFAEYLREHGTGRQKKKSIRISECGAEIEFGVYLDKDGNNQHGIRRARFCGAKLCTFCAKGRAMNERERFAVALNTIHDPEWIPEWKPARGRSVDNVIWLSLTLTVPNVPVTDVGQTITKMQKAFTNMVRRKQWPALGWVRNLEITKEKKRPDYAHPHFHCLLPVRPSYFKSGNYLNVKQWSRLWSDCYGSDIDLQVKVSRVRSKNKESNTGQSGVPYDAILECIKYPNKLDESMIVDNPEWITELDRQLHKRRLLESGGIVGEAYKMANRERIKQFKAEMRGQLNMFYSAIWGDSERSYSIKDRPAYVN